jgi:hypothetical protein
MTLNALRCSDAHYTRRDLVLSQHTRKDKEQANPFAFNNSTRSLARFNPSR